MRIALAQINTTVGDFDGNKALIVDAYRKAITQGAELVLTPELAICGYPPRDLVHRSRFVPANTETLHAIAAEVGAVPLMTGFVDINRDGGKPFHNAAAVLQHGKVQHIIHKSLLPTYDVFDEDRYFEPASIIAPVTVNSTRLGITICEDIWNDDYLPRPLYNVAPPEVLAKQGIDILVNISASPFSLGKPQIRERMLCALARELRVPIAYCNSVGGNDQLIFDGSSVVIDADGKLISRLAPFDSELAVVDV